MSTYDLHIAAMAASSRAAANLNVTDNGTGASGDGPGVSARVFSGHEAAVYDQLKDENDQRAMDNSIRWAAANQQTTIQQTTDTNVPPDVNTAPAAPPMYSQGRQVKMNDVADPTRDDLITVLSVPGIAACIEHWKKVNGTDELPSPAIEPSAEQHGVFQMYYYTGQVPYFDMGIFGPYFNRTFCQIMRVGLMWAPDGTLIRAVFQGPPAVEYWTPCLKVYGCGMESWDMADPHVMRKYESFIKL